jgi:hypothetical protein
VRYGTINPRRRTGLRTLQSCQIQGFPYPIHRLYPEAPQNAQPDDIQRTNE